ncbi:recQ [Mytilus coruscus]|uniref:RecQ n=1 Tax=Mytilus coruscus TaxID=42192 RepID=A0A6J8EBY3_MYTCO|nr:recQ [Mytilus coruscus]
MEVVEAIQRCNILKIALASVNVKRKTAYQALKPQQTRTLLASIQNDVLSILPTGYGKSLIFECLPRVVSLSRKLPSAIILVSPLNSIILEQVSRYNDLAIEVTEQFLNNLKIHHSLCSSTTINSNNCSCQGVVKQFTTGTFMFLIGHPEQMIHKDLFKELRHDRYQTLLTHLVIDEAHCVEKWGKDFRKDFSKLRELRY